MQFTNQKVKLSVSIPGCEVDHPPHVSITFDVDFHACSWGIKSVDLLLTDKLAIPLSYVRFSDPAANVTECTILVDLSKIKVARVDSGQITVTELDIYMHNSMATMSTVPSVNYSLSEITVAR